jgi:predicted  nucleic acid-binding Zn-ribbon protein
MDEITEKMESAADKARLRSEIEQLKKDIAAVSKTLADKGSQMFDRMTEQDEASALDGLKQRGSRAASAIGHQARRIGDTPTQNSVSTLLIIAGLGIVIGMLAR